MDEGVTEVEGPPKPELKGPVEPLEKGKDDDDDGVVVVVVKVFGCRLEFEEDENGEEKEDPTGFEPGKAEGPLRPFK